MIALDPYAAVAPPPTVVQYNQVNNQLATLTFAFTATPTDGNLMLVSLSSTGGMPTGTPPGWVQVTSVATGPNHHTLYAKIAAGESNSYSWTFGSAQQFALVGCEVAGADPVLYVNVAGGVAGSGLPCTPPSLSPPTVLNCLPLWWAANNQTALINALTAEWTNLIHSPATHIADVLLQGTVTTDTSTVIDGSFQWNVSTTWWDAVLVLVAPVQPAQTGPPPPGLGGGAFGLGDHVHSAASPGAPAWQVRSVESGVNSFYPQQSVPQDVPHDTRTSDAHTAYFTQPRRGGG